VKKINKMINKYPDDLCLLVLEFLLFKVQREYNQSKLPLSVATGLVTGLLTGIAITPGLILQVISFYIAVYF